MCNSEDIAFIRIKHICQVFCLCVTYVSLSRSSCSMAASSSLVIFVYRMQSSANSLTLHDKNKDSGKSLMKRRKSNGPVTVPWGTLDSTSTHGEFSPSTITRCFLFVTNDLIQACVLFLIPQRQSLSNSLWWYGVSYRRLSWSPWWLRYISLVFVV